MTSAGDQPGHSVVIAPTGSSLRRFGRQRTALIRRVTLPLSTPTNARTHARSSSSTHSLTRGPICTPLNFTGLDLDLVHSAITRAPSPVRPTCASQTPLSRPALALERVSSPVPSCSGVSLLLMLTVITTTSEEVHRTWLQRRDQATTGPGGCGGRTTALKSPVKQYKQLTRTHASTL